MLLGERYEYHEDTKIIKHVVFSSDVTSFHQDLPMTKSNCNFDSYYELSMVWGLTYKTSILIASGLRWDEGVFYTDNEFDFWPLKLIKTIRFIPIPVYVYLLGREGQSVSVNNQERNFNSYVVVSNSMMDELLKVYNKESEVGEMQLFFCWRVFCHVFPKLLYFGGTHKEELVVFTSKLQNNRNVFDYFNKKMTCYGINYIDAYFNNKILLYYIRLRRAIERQRYKLATNKSIRRIFGKKDNI